MKKIIFLLSVLLLSSYGVFAQSGEISIGARGGLSIPKIQAFGNNPMSSGYSSRLMGGGGVFMEYRFSQLFSLRPGIEYSAQGGKRDGMQAIPKRMLPTQISQIPGLPEYLYADFDSKTTFDYLMIPVLAQVGWDLGKASPFRIYVNAGPFVSFLFSASQTTSGMSKIYRDKDGTQAITPIDMDFGRKDDIKDQTNTVNWGIAGNVGLAYQMGKHRFFIEGGGNYGFLKLQKDGENGENRIGTGTVMIGYAFRIK